MKPNRPRPARPAPKYGAMAEALRRAGYQLAGQGRANPQSAGIAANAGQREGQKAGP